MNQLYVVAKPFKSAGVFYARGTLITHPEQIKLFRFKVEEKKILPIPDNKVELESLCDLFAIKLKTDLRKILADAASKGQEVQQEKSASVTGGVVTHTPATIGNGAQETIVPKPPRSTTGVPAPRTTSRTTTK